MQTKIKFKKTFILLFLCIYSSSCITNVEEQFEEITGEDPSVVVKVSFKEDIKKIIDGRCLSCHASSGDFPELTSYTKISTHAIIVKDEVASGRMPRGARLTARQIKTVIAWIDQGALDN